MRSTLLIVLAAGVLPTTAIAQNTITLFGQEYSVARINYSAEIQLPNIPFPQDPSVPFIESEGIVYTGGDRILMSADDISDAGFGMPENWIVEATLRYESGVVVGFQAVRTILSHDLASFPYDLNPTGISLNTGSTGLGAGGNIIASLGDGWLYAYSYQAGSEGNQLPFPNGSDCLSSPATCAMNISGLNTNAEDLTYVPVNGGEIFVANQDTEGLERWNAVTGQFVGSFPVGGAVPGGPVGAVAKGLSYVADSPALPSVLRRPEGVVLVCFDDNFPALQAFSVTGELLATEVLTVDGTAFGTPKLDVAGCPGGLALESLTADAASGRLFLSNQGSFTDCNFLWVLTPVAGGCPADFNGDGFLDFFDYDDYVNCFETGTCGDRTADFNSDEFVDFFDYDDFVAAFEAGC
jgi:hypothetical protein